MLRLKFVALCLLAAAAVASAYADQPPSSRRFLTEAEVRDALVGRPVAGVYPTGQSWSEQMRADGSTHYVEQRGSYRGRWWFSARGDLCFEYEGNGGGGCFVYVKLSPNCFEHFFEAKPGELGSLGAPRGLITNGKLWRSDEPATCEEKPTA